MNTPLTLLEKRLGLGCWAIGGPFWADAQPLGWGQVNDCESERAIRAGLDLGISLFDTADVYGAGHSETILGKALGADRHRVAIATKWGNVFSENSRQLTGTDITSKYVREACEASLRRLGTDWIDIYQLHVGDCAIELLSDLIAELEGLVAAGKIRFFGWSTDDVARATAFLEQSNASVIQFELNVLTDNAAMVSVLEERTKVGLIRGPLAMGLLSGKYSEHRLLDNHDVRNHTLTWMKYFKDGAPAPAYRAGFERVREALTTGGRTLVQGALAWIWARGQTLVPIPGFRTPAQVKELIGALDFGPFTQAETAALEMLMRPDYSPTLTRGKDDKQGGQVNC
jgi:aryl-alcohol dehydrogenase-like predicted oxidoreductase